MPGSSTSPSKVPEPTRVAHICILHALQGRRRETASALCAASSSSALACVLIRSVFLMHPMRVCVLVCDIQR